MAFKQVSALTGSALHPHPQERLIQLYTYITRYLRKYPKDSKYRKNTEIILQFRKSALDEGQNIKEIEDMIGCGRTEQLILQAERELCLAKKLLAYKPWEPLSNVPPENQWTWPMVKS